MCSVDNLETYYSLLRCVCCGGQVVGEGASAQGELKCQSCSRVYQTADGIPVMFADVRREKILLDPEAYARHLAELEDKADQAAGMTADQLGKFRQREPDDALGWEILFWERWKNEDAGFLEFDAESIEDFLTRDQEGGGRLGFLDEIRSRCENLEGKKLLNIGAGRDFLLERLGERGCEVIEQDTVLEPLGLLKGRGSSFCICGDARRLPFADNSFDIVTSFAVLHHIWPIEEPLAEILRVLKPGGLAFFNEPNAYALTRAALILPNALKRRLKKMYSGDDTPSPYECSINPYQFRRAVRAFGGEVADFSFKRTSWISPDARGLKRILRTVNLAAVRLFPVVSSHFSAMVRKG